ncbi:MAG: LuxR C-terminal-related transcriptional regulator, partial [Chloroflexota bacterium]
PQAAYRVRARAHTLLGDFDRARHDYELVLERGRAAEEPAVAWQALIDLGMLWSERDYERTGGYYRAALDLARETDDPLMVACSLDHVGNWHVNIDEPDLAIPLHQEALARFAESGDQQGMADSLGFLGMATFLKGDLPASTGYSERAIALYRALDKRQGLATCLGTLTFTGGQPITAATPTYREAAYWLRAGEEALAIARDMGWAAGEAWASYALSSARCARGDLGQALDDATAALTIARQIGHVQWTIAASHGSGVVWTELLDPVRATTHLEAGLALARGSGSRFWTNTLATTLASLLLSVGEIGQAAAIIDTVIPGGGARPSRWRQYGAVQAELELARDQPDRALAIIDQLLALPPTFPLERTSPLLVTLRAHTLRRLARPDEADATYHAARQGAILFGFSPLRWRIELAHGELYRAEGEPAAAAAFQRARATIAELAASIPDDEMRSGFRQRAASLISGASTEGGAAGLSARELDVLRLLVEGHSDREIGEALHISPRTVMRHVTGILNKLGVSTRTAAASQAFRQGLV